MDGKRVAAKAAGMLAPGIVLLALAVIVVVGVWSLVSEWREDRK